MDACFGYGDDFEDVPDYFSDVLQRIKDCFKSYIEIYSYDDEWLNFGISGRGDLNAMLLMESNKYRILPGSDALRYQILCSWGSQDGSGLWLHYMDDVATRQDYRGGCWFY